MTYLARLALTLALAGAMSPEFNRQEPITLDLRDASVTDVITMLGALANVPVSIAPDVTGTVTIQVTDVPYSKVLEMIGAQNALALRFENGKLVATRSQVPLPAIGGGGSVPAPKAERTGPRIPVEGYAAASGKSKPLYLRVRVNESQVCGRIDVDKGGSFELAIPGWAEPAVVTQFGWDPASRTRFLAVEMPEATAKAFVFREIEEITSSEDFGPNRRTFGWSLGPERPCSDVAAPAQRQSKGQSMIRMEVTEAGGQVVMAPQVGIVSGMAFSMRAGAMAVSGQHDETVIFGYLSADGKSVAAALQATAIRTDPKDGKEYVYSQVSPADSVRFIPIGVDPVVLAVLPSGPAREKPLELTGSLVRRP